MADVLVVDDSKVMREMVVACLRASEDLTFTHAASGLEAIERLSLKRFDLVVLDLNMPDIGGIEVVEFVRGQDTLRALPIIIVTTRGDEASRARALAAGRDALHDQAVHAGRASSPRCGRLLESAQGRRP